MKLIKRVIDDMDDCLWGWGGGRIIRIKNCGFKLIKIWGKMQ